MVLLQAHYTVFLIVVGNLNSSPHSGPWSCEGSMCQCRGMLGPGMGVGGLVSRGRGEAIGAGGFQRGNQERG